MPGMNLRLVREMRLGVVLGLLALPAMAPRAAAEALPTPPDLAALIDRAETPVAGFEVVNTYPHDPEAFTQGLLWADGRLYESTGLEGRSSLRRVRLETGEVEQRVDLPRPIFAEGLASIDRRLIQLSWRNQVAFVYGRRDLFQIDKRPLAGYEGWGLTSDGRQLIASDGSATLRFLDPQTLETSRTLQVTTSGRPLPCLNELEYIDGEIWANIWQTRFIARIDPASGAVRGWVDLSELPTGAEPGAQVDVLNGIAWDAEGRRLFVTGKLWPRLYEIRVKE